jgi:hypothetical protein
MQPGRNWTKQKTRDAASTKMPIDRGSPLAGCGVSLNNDAVRNVPENPL